MSHQGCNLSYQSFTLSYQSSKMSHQSCNISDILALRIFEKPYLGVRVTVFDADLTEMIAGALRSQPRKRFGGRKSTRTPLARACVRACVRARACA